MKQILFRVIKYVLSSVTCDYLGDSSGNSSNIITEPSSDTVTVSSKKGSRQSVGGSERSKSQSVSVIKFRRRGSRQSVDGSEESGLLSMNATPVHIHEVTTSKSPVVASPRPDIPQISKSLPSHL